MSTIEDVREPPIGVARRIGQVISWIFGLLFLLMGLVSLIPGTGSPTAGSWGLVAAGALLLPPVSGLIRRQAGLLRPIWAPPVVAIVLFMVSAAITGAHTAAPQPASPAPPAAAPQPQPDPATPRDTGSQSTW